MGTRYKLSHSLSLVNQSTLQRDKIAAQLTLAFVFLAVTLFGEGFGIDCTAEQESQVCFIVL